MKTLNAFFWVLPLMGDCWMRPELGRTNVIIKSSQNIYTCTLVCTHTNKSLSLFFVVRLPLSFTLPIPKLLEAIEKSEAPYWDTCLLMTSSEGLYSAYPILSRRSHTQAGTYIIMLPFNKYHVIICNQCEKFPSELFKLWPPKAFRAKWSECLPLACQELTFRCISRTFFLLGYDRGC